MLKSFHCNSTWIVVKTSAFDTLFLKAEIVNDLLMWFDGQIFCSGDIKYAGQPFGLVVANSHHLAHQAALKVKAEYGNVRKPLTDLREVIASGDKTRIKVEKEPECMPQGKLAAFTWVRWRAAMHTYSDTITLPVCWSHINSRLQLCDTCYITSTTDACY